MGNGVGKLGHCFAGSGEVSRRHDIDFILSDHPLDEGLGHSFCYIRPDPFRLSTSKVHSEEVETTTFRSISGASVSANAFTPLSTSLLDHHLYPYASLDKASAFESSNSFASIPLQPVPRNSISGPLPKFSGGIPGSGPMERGFLSGPIERGFVSGPIDRSFVSGPIDRGVYSGPMEKPFDQLQRSFSHGGFGFKRKSKRKSLMKAFQRAITNMIPGGHKSIVAPIKSESDKNNECSLNASANLSSNGSLNDDVYVYDGDESLGSQNLQWAQGKAGEDRVHVVISEERGWVFVGIYDGFNGPDAPDFLLSNLYPAVQKELKGLLWNEKFESPATAVFVAESALNSNSQESSPPIEEFDWPQTRNPAGDECCQCYDQPENSPSVSGEVGSKKKRCRISKSKNRGLGRKWEENQRKWRQEWERERLELDRRLKEHLNQLESDGAASINHSDVLKALSLALKKTEEAYLEIADKMVMENPELALMGSCVLVMLMKGENVYLMNVGDSRAVLARKFEPDLWLGQDLERINEETLNDLQSYDGDEFDRLPSLASLQVTMDHSTSVEEEVQKILREHPDDASAVINDRVKGSLKVTRAFGAGYLKQPKWNNALLEMFRIDYVGANPYITCSPSLYHHRLSPKDRFLILSSDGLYQYFTNEEAVSEVELFIAAFPEGDPAQHLIEEVLFRAAKKAGMDFHELLDIPQGDRRKYHDDVSVIVISLEGRIWRSSV
ncbi:probable protein phosphatase 2C 23 [Malania oleifera]|uniref:probable protein phosphatase 2C 23 n=1 Tax=Malania oleifera TaxID=397392 RepID=UPI0025ADCC32|nr:probable protein phosphatase 2C 23 [Malania oleifera]